MKESICPLSNQICKERIKNLQSNPKGLLLLKKYLKLIFKKGVLCPELFFNKNIDFAFFPRPSEEFLHHYYTFTEEKNIVEWRKFSYSPSMQETAYSIVKMASEFDIFKMDFAKMKIMDYGCGTGWFSFAMLKKNKNIYALDFNQELLNYLKKESGGIINGVLNTDLYKYKKFFDFVFSFDTFEHLSNPLQEAKLIYNSLSDNGSCAIAVPNFNSYLFKIDISNHPYFSYPAHLNYFTSKSIKYMMKTAGFKKVKVFDTTYSWEKIYMMQELYKKGLIKKKCWHLNDIWNEKGNGEHLICFCSK